VDGQLRVAAQGQQPGQAHGVQAHHHAGATQLVHQVVAAAHFIDLAGQVEGHHGLAGADHLHVNGLANKFSEPDDSVIAAARAVLRPLDAAKPMPAMPVFSSGQTGLQAAPTYAALGSTDLIHAAGGGILGHPGGIQAGVLAMRQAWDAAVAGTPLATHAARHPELAQALDTW